MKTDPDWNDFVRACDAVGIDPPAMQALLIRWWGRQPGVTLPKRPERPE